MHAKIERIGDGFGLILPKELLDACGFGSEANVAVQDKSLIVTPQPRRAREGWAEALARIPQEELDRDFEELQAFRETPNEWDATEWQCLIQNARPCVSGGSRSDLHSAGRPD